MDGSADVLSVAEEGTSGGAGDTTGAAPVVDRSCAEAGPRISTDAENINASAVAPRIQPSPEMTESK
jgi:hypothetical protein